MGALLGVALAVGADVRAILAIALPAIGFGLLGLRKDLVGVPATSRLLAQIVIGGAAAVPLVRGHELPLPLTGSSEMSGV